MNRYFFEPKKVPSSSMASCTGISSAKWIPEAYTREHVTASEGMGMTVGKERL